MSGSTWWPRSRCQRHWSLANRWQATSGAFRPRPRQTGNDSAAWTRRPYRHAIAGCEPGRGANSVVQPRDRLLIRQGEVLPVDGRVATELAALDLSALTGESVPTRLNRGGEALSGATSVGAAFELV